MLHLLDPKKILPAYAIATTAVSVMAFLAIQYAFTLNWEVYKIVTLSSTVSSVLILILLSAPVTRIVWKTLQWWDKDVYPDLTGCWEGKINPASENAAGTDEPLVVRAKIKHSILALFIDFHGKTFDSITLSATPLVEKGQQHLHYVYRSESKIPGRETYNGTAVLRVGTVKTDKGTILSLKGQYHTDRRTVGTIELFQTGTDTSQDVTF